MAVHTDAFSPITVWFRFFVVEMDLEIFFLKNLQKNPFKEILNILLDKKIKMQECAVPNA